MRLGNYFNLPTVFYKKFPVSPSLLQDPQEIAETDSPRTPTSPFKRKFSFKFKGGSPKGERRNFSEEAATITDLLSEEGVSEEAREAYDSLVQKGVERSTSLPPATAPKPVVVEERLTLGRSRPVVGESRREEETGSDVVDSNPLRMLRSGGPVRPKVE